jgi:gamma-glutamyltranspeptidase/glutathione hydrolase
VQPAVAGGHPATVAAGAEILAEGGTAADAAVGASLASSVAETVMTGLLGGGHAIVLDGATGRVENLDFFVAVPGLGAEPRDIAPIELQVPFGAELVHYAVGIASCGVPGVPAGLHALWQRYGRLPWPRLVEPALRIARDGVEMLPAHASCLAMLAPVMTMNEGARIYSPAGRLLETGDRLEQPGLVAALELVASEGALTAYEGSLARSLLGLMEERGGLVTSADLATYEVLWSEPVEASGLRAHWLTRADLSGVPETLPRLPRFARLAEADRVVKLATALAADARDGRVGDTTNLVTADAAGTICVVTTSLGLGSGDFLPGLDVHLNSMLGEADLLRGRLEPGARMHSMMAPSIAFDRDGPALAIGAAGGTRLRSALLQVAAGVLDEGLTADAAVERPRVHAAGRRAQLEPGFADETVSGLADAGFEVRVWPSQHHYFGGVSLVTRSGAAGDPRRSGAARLLR